MNYCAKSSDNEGEYQFDAIWYIKPPRIEEETNNAAKTYLVLIFIVFGMQIVYRYFILPCSILCDRLGWTSKGGNKKYGSEISDWKDNVFTQCNLEVLN